VSREARTVSAGVGGTGVAWRCVTVRGGATVVVEGVKKSPEPSSVAAASNATTRNTLTKVRA
jgi:hypothetical protein